MFRTHQAMDVGEAIVGHTVHSDLNGVIRQNRIVKASSMSDVRTDLNVHLFGTVPVLVLYKIIH